MLFCSHTSPTFAKHLQGFHYMAENIYLISRLAPDEWAVLFVLVVVTVTGAAVVVVSSFS